ncbi:hypothetical protein [Chromobacterium violaceum]|uniref:hypothetical protein n=1 Tax=Chromobacterium violaceum TaxID=536 RepID=UPI0005B9B1DA|nr:hypothetical protein [Chromobacterium violaceum]
MATDPNVLTKQQAIHTPSSDKRVVGIEHGVCDDYVPPAADSIIGQCEFYYRPLHQEYVKKSGVSALQAITAWATSWNPWDDVVVAGKLLRNRDKLIMANSSDDNWSRHASFMMRHIGCGHKPPDYYVSYGYYYCSNYGKKLMPRLSPDGQKWLQDGRQFLQRNMEDGLKQNMVSSSINIPSRRYPNRSANLNVPKRKLEINNAVFKKFAFDTHVPAYLDAGLADLPISDLTKIGGQPNIEEWADGATWKQAIDSGVEVSKEWSGRAVEGSKGLAERAMKTLMSVFK